MLAFVEDIASRDTTTRHSVKKTLVSYSDGGFADTGASLATFQSQKDVTVTRSTRLRVVELVPDVSTTAKEDA